MRDISRRAALALTVFWACSLHGLAQESALVVPSGSGVTIDGTFTAREWEGGLRAGGTDVGVVLMSAEGFLQVAVRARSPLVVSLCLAKGDKVQILHASAALGRATYVKQGEEWRLTEAFEWRLRTTDLGPAGVAERQEHRARHGWVASTARMGAPEEFEYQISTGSLVEDGTRFALGLLLEGDAISGWPMGPGEDGCTDRSVVAGPPAQQALFHPDRWPVLRLAR